MWYDGGGVGVRAEIIFLVLMLRKRHSMIHYSSARQQRRSCQEIFQLKQELTRILYWQQVHRHNIRLRQFLKHHDYQMQQIQRSA